MVNSAVDRRSFLSSLAAAAIWPGQQLQTGLDGESTLGVGLIGLGFRGFQYLRCLEQEPLARPVAFGDLWRPHFARVRESGVRARFYTPMFVKVLMMGDVDLAILAVPDHLHGYMAGQALEWRRPVLVEPPLTFRESELPEIRRRQAEVGISIFVGSQYARSPLTVQAGQWIRAGVIGNVTGVSATIEGFLGGYSSLPAEPLLPEREWKWFLKDREADYDPHHFFQWSRYTAFSVGPARRHVAHLLSILDEVLDPGEAVRAEAIGHRRESEHGADIMDDVSGVIEFSGGPPLRFSATDTRDPLTFNLCFEGESGRIELGPRELIRFRPSASHSVQASRETSDVQESASRPESVGSGKQIDSSDSEEIVERLEYLEDPTPLYLRQVVEAVKNGTEGPDPARQDRLERAGYLVARSLQDEQRAPG